MKAKEIVALCEAVRILHEYARRTEPDYEKEPCAECIWAQQRVQRGCADWQCDCSCHERD